MNNDQTEIETAPARIEETAKFLLGISAGTSGLYLSVFKLAMGKTAVAGFPLFLPFLFWAAAMVLLVLVIFPQKYETYKNEPASMKNVFLKARTIKYRRLFAGTLLFILGILSGVFVLI